MKKYNNKNFNIPIPTQKIPIEYQNQEEIIQNNKQEVQKKTKECGFINVTDPNLRKTIAEISKCPSDATNFTFWYNKIEPNNWGLTIKSLIRGSQSEYERLHGMIFNSQHTWKITWYNDENVLKVANHSKSLAEDLCGDDYITIKKIYELYKSTK